MARSDLLLSIVKAGVAGDASALRSSVEAVVADERAKNHHIVADRLERVLNAVSVTPPARLNSQKNKGPDGRNVILETTPRTHLSELILPLPVSKQIRELVEEQNRADLLRAHGMQPRHRILFSGPPGNGKTSLAEATAEALSVPFFTVRYDMLIGSYLGETNTRLAALFEYARTVPCVLFFDEFDSIGKERGDEHETGEIKRVVSFLLMQIDQLPSYVVTIAATNHAELLDRAVWRRFQLKLSLPEPTESAIAKYLDRQMISWTGNPGQKAETIAKKLGRISFAEAEEFSQNVRRKQILTRGEISLKVILKDELNYWTQRVTADKNDVRPRKAITQTKRSKGSGKT
jgi:SpoVK/Ycf46/Vps4 family AAA+-type ATPase